LEFISGAAAATGHPNIGLNELFRMALLILNGTLGKHYSHRIFVKGMEVVALKVPLNQYHRSLLYIQVSASSLQTTHK
jgi:hypothetical protein